MRNFPFWRGAIHKAKTLSALESVKEDIDDFQKEPVFYSHEPKLSDAQIEILNKLLDEKTDEFLRHSREAGRESRQREIEMPVINKDVIRFPAMDRGSSRNGGFRETLERKKSEIISAIKEELFRLGIQIKDEDIRTATAGNTWSIWVEQKDAFDTGRDKYVVDLGELAEGVNYVVAVPYRMRRWVTALGGRFTPLTRDLAAGNQKRGAILMAEDDEDDYFLIKKALEKNSVKNPLIKVSDGEELLDYLHHRGKFSGSDPAPAPSFILLDLNMPRMDGRATLKAIKKDRELQKIPVVILTTSKSEEDILNGYAEGASSYITKPSNFDGFVKIIQVLQSYWLDTVKLPA